MVMRLATGYDLTNIMFMVMNERIKFQDSVKKRIKDRTECFDNQFVLKNKYYNVYILVGSDFFVLYLH